MNYMYEKIVLYTNTNINQRRFVLQLSNHIFICKMREEQYPPSYVLESYERHKSNIDFNALLEDEYGYKRENILENVIVFVECHLKEINKSIDKQYFTHISINSKKYFFLLDHTKTKILSQSCGDFSAQMKDSIKMSLPFQVFYDLLSNNYKTPKRTGSVYEKYIDHKLVTISFINKVGDDESEFIIYINEKEDKELTKSVKGIYKNKIPKKGFKYISKALFERIKIILYGKDIFNILIQYNSGYQKLYESKTKSEICSIIKMKYFKIHHIIYIKNQYNKSFRIENFVSTIKWNKSYIIYLILWHIHSIFWILNFYHKKRANELLYLFLWLKDFLEFFWGFES